MLKNGILVLVSTLICLVVLELLLRAIAPVDEVSHVLDDDLIYRHAPHRQLRFVRFPEHGGDIIETRFDAHGFREGSGDPLDKNAYRIFVYGDSFIQASYSHTNETFAEQLAQRLASSADRPVAVVNAGVDGYGPDQTYLRLLRETPVFEPDLVIVSLFADNDFGDLIRNRLFRLDTQGKLEHQAFDLDDELLQHYEQRQWINDAPALLKLVTEPELLRRDLRILLERRLGLEAGMFSDVAIDTTYRTATDIDWIDIWLRRGTQEYRDYLASGPARLKLDNLRSDHYDADMVVEPDSARTRYKIALMDALLEEMVSSLHAKGIPVVLLIIPSPVDACKPYDWVVDTGKYPNYDRRLLTQSLVRIADRLEVPYVDLFDSFASEDCNALFFHHGNNHWNARGQALAADRVAELIRSRRTLEITTKR